MKTKQSIEARLNAVIKSLEGKQELNYDSITHLVLSYIYDIKNDSVPEYVYFMPIHERRETKFER